MEKSSKLVVYYSLDGNTRFIAETVAKAAGAELLELRTKSDLKRLGFFKFFIGGMQVMFKLKPELLPLEKKVQDYDLIFLGTPVWAGRYVPAFITFFSKQALKKKKIALFCCCGDKSGKTFELMKKTLAGNTFLGEVELKRPLALDPEGKIKQTQKWVQEVLAKYGNVRKPNPGNGNPEKG